MANGKMKSDESFKAGTEGTGAALVPHIEPGQEVPGDRKEGASRVRLVAGELYGDLKTFKGVWLALAIFFAANVLLYSLTALLPSVQESLSLSGDKPWGIVISVFLHGDLGHLSGNLAWFALCAILYMFLNIHHGLETKRYSGKIFLYLVYLSGLTTNYLQFLMWRLRGVFNVTAIGSSGVVYTSLGVLMASALYNSLGLKDWLKSGQRFNGPKRKFGVGMICVNLVMFAVLFLNIILHTEDFLNVAPGVNVFGHGVGFYMGFLPSLCLFHLKSPAHNPMVKGTLKRRAPE